MKVLITYSSKTGNTEKLARGIFEGISAKDKTLLPMSEVTDMSEYDVVLAGYWVDKAGPNEEAKSFLASIAGKKVGIFATLAYWPDTQHGWDSLLRGEELVAQNNQVIGKYVCQGKLSDKIIAYFETLPSDNPHAVGDFKRKRYAIAKNHPTEIDIAAGAQLFEERLIAYV